MKLKIEMTKAAHVYHLCFLYYFHQQINKPNEFDIMLKLKVPRVTLSALEQYDGLFYSVKLSKSTRLNVQHFLLEDGLTISATKIKKEMHRLVRKFISNYKGMLNFIVM